MVTFYLNLFVHLISGVHTYTADSSTSWEQGRYATKVKSFEKDPGLKHVTPVYLNAFCSLLSPKTICINLKHLNLCTKLDELDLRSYE